MTQKWTIRLIMGGLALWALVWLVAGVVGDPNPPGILMWLGPLAIIVGIALISEFTRRP